MNRRAAPLERLVDANPKFYGTDSGRAGTCLGFDCPIHEDCEVIVPFENPIDGGPCTHPTGWHRTGDTPETLTLSPSIRVMSAERDPSRCGWHGFIRDGRFETCGDSR